MIFNFERDTKTDITPLHHHFPHWDTGGLQITLRTTQVCGLLKELTKEDHPCGLTTPDFDSVYFLRKFSTACTLMLVIVIFVSMTPTSCLLTFILSVVGIQGDCLPSL